MFGGVEIAFCGLYFTMSSSKIKGWLESTISVQTFYACNIFSLEILHWLEVAIFSDVLIFPTSKDTSMANILGSLLH